MKNKTNNQNKKGIKEMKKTLSMLLAFSMLLGLLTTMAFAADTYTITAPANDHTYEVYQIFVGDLSDTTLSNVKWGQNGTGTAGEAVAKDVLTEIAGTTGTDTQKLAVITKYVNLTTEAFKLVGEEAGENNTRVASVDVPAGYYLIKDVDNSLSGENDAYTLFLVEVVGDVTITPKANVPTFEKKVKDTNDSTGETTGWQDSADYDIGDDVPFQLTGKVADNYDAYTKYQFVFHDKESAGLTFNNDVKVYVDGVEITEGYEVVTEDLTDGCTFEVVFENLKTINAVKANSIITVEYTSKLNESAVIGAAGNPNEVYLEFSNNPNWKPSGTDGEKTPTGETPEDKVIVFTYKTVINKVDGEKNPLAGAEFKLYKKVGEEWVEVKDKLTLNAEKTTFTWTGLDDGDYKLSETMTPAGYNTIEDIE
ncbi:MAG: isopeptide-forming domain-containing fimbrial protein, partial [Clostridia bacterium]|nr:isopeptide-forming domain-containing fimbrial protein [Clostridia bacterium]